MQIDSKHKFTDFTIRFVGRRHEVIWPRLYYHLSSVRQNYAIIILIWQQNDNYQSYSIPPAKSLVFQKILHNRLPFDIKVQKCGVVFCSMCLYVAHRRNPFLTWILNALMLWLCRTMMWVDFRIAHEDYDFD